MISKLCISLLLASQFLLSQVIGAPKKRWFEILGYLYYFLNLWIFFALCALVLIFVAILKMYNLNNCASAVSFLSTTSGSYLFDYW